MLVAEYFDEIYRKHRRYWWQNKDRYTSDYEAYPYSLLTQLTLKLLAGRAPGRALDLGAGEGPDSIRLALLGYQVDAVEISRVAANKIRTFASDAGVNVNVIFGDIRNQIPDGPYDVIICNGVLHYIENKIPVINRIKEVTRPEGVNVISLWSSYTPVPECHNHNGVPVYLDDENGVIIHLYRDWPKEFIYFERDKPDSAHSDLPPHRHSHIKLITRNPDVGERG